MIVKDYWHNIVIEFSDEELAQNDLYLGVNNNELELDSIKYDLYKSVNFLSSDFIIAHSFLDYIYLNESIDCYISSKEKQKLIEHYELLLEEYLSMDLNNSINLVMNYLVTINNFKINESLKEAP